MKVPFVDLASVHESLAAELGRAWTQFIAKGQYVLGALLDEFEDEFATYCHAKYCVGVGNGLDALTLALLALGVTPGDEVIVPATTFIATWLAVTRVGAVPVPVEPDPATCNMDPSRIERAVTPRTAAIVPVDLYGQLVDYQTISRIARRNGVKILEDAAQAHGARIENVSAGSWADAAAFSFFPTKNLGCLGDGGAVVTNDPDVAEKIRKLRNYGSSRKYYNDLLGFNSRLDPLQAAILHVKLQYLEHWNDKRRKIASIYQAGLAGLPSLRLPTVAAEYSGHVWHLYVIHHPQRDELQRQLHSAGIETLIHYPIPPHLSQAYMSIGYAGRLPISETLAREALSLPIGPHLQPDHVAHVIYSVREFCLSEWQGRDA